MHTGRLLTWSDFRIVIAFVIFLVRDFQHLSRAEHNTHLAFFATLWKDVDLAAGRGDSVDIERRASEDSHRITSLTGK
jgi:hypothetical protein